MEKTLIFVQKILAATIGVQFTKIPRTEANLLDYIQQCTHHTFDSLLKHASVYWQRIFAISHRSDTIYEYLALGGITFLVYTDYSKNDIYLLGPVQTKPLSQEDILLDIKHYNIQEDVITQILGFCTSLPVIPNYDLYRTGNLVLCYLLGRDKPLKIAPSNVLSSVDEYMLTSVAHQGEDVARMRQIELRYEYSAALTEAIKQGNFSLAKQLIGHYSSCAQNPVRNLNPLRNAQNYCIVLNTQLRHAMEDCGIHPYRVDQLSNEIGLEIEQLSDLSKLPIFLEEVIRRYCLLVQEHAYPNLKPLANLAVTYIKEHLSENLTVKETAVNLGVNANYLSTQFRKSTGMTFIDFVHYERTRQAAALLQRTNLQVQQIASIVGYNNTSYFTKQFLYFQGTNPSHYRRESTR